MAIPVIESVTTATAVSLATDLTVAYPSSIAAGDLLLVVVVNDEKNIATALYDDSTNKPTGFTLINESGNDYSDSHVAAFYKVAAGTETGNFTIPCVSSNANTGTCGWCFRISGAHGSSPLDVTGADSQSTSSYNLTDLDLASCTTTENDCLAFGVACFDGGDGYNFTITGTGWTKESELTEDVADTDTASGVVSTKDMATAGATGVCTVAGSVLDGISGFTFAIAPVEIIGTVDAVLPDITLDIYAGSIGVGGGGNTIVGTNMIAMQLGVPPL